MHKRRPRAAWTRPVHQPAHVGHAHHNRTLHPGCMGATATLSPPRAAARPFLGLKPRLWHRRGLSRRLRVFFRACNASPPICQTTVTTNGAAADQPRSRQAPLAVHGIWVRSRTQPTRPQAPPALCGKTRMVVWGVVFRALRGGYRTTARQSWRIHGAGHGPSFAWSHASYRGPQAARGHENRQKNVCMGLLQEPPRRVGATAPRTAARACAQVLDAPFSRGGVSAVPLFALNSASTCYQARTSRPPAAVRCPWRATAAPTFAHCVGASPAVSHTGRRCRVAAPSATDRARLIGLSRASSATAPLAAARTRRAGDGGVVRTCPAVRGCSASQADEDFARRATTPALGGEPSARRGRRTHQEPVQSPRIDVTALCGPLRGPRGRHARHAERRRVAAVAARLVGVPRA